MKKIFAIVTVMGCLIPSLASAQIPMPDFLHKIISIVEQIEEQAATFQKEVVNVVQEEVQKATKFVGSVKEKAEKVINFAENAGNAIKNLNAESWKEGIQQIASLAGTIENPNFTEDLERLYVYDSNLNYEEYTKKMQVLEDSERRLAASLYAEAFVRRLELIDEMNEEKKAPEMSVPTDTLRAQMYMQTSVALRFNNIMLYEAMSSELYYTHQLSQHSTKSEEEE